MAKKIITISGIQYEVDDSNPNYKKRITPEPTLKSDAVNAARKAKEIAKFIASPEFVKYMMPGVNTVAFAQDASTNVNEAFQHLKAGEYQQAAADASYTIGNILSGAASLAHFSGLAVKPNPKFKVGITKSPGASVDLTTPGPDSPVTFTGEELLDQGKTRLRRTLNDAEYREALQKAFPKTWEEHLNNQLKELNKAKLDLTLLPDEPNIMQTTGESYETILNNWSSGKYRPDPNIDDLIQYYDRESLLSYLNNFLKDGGKINYFEYFQ